MVKKGIIALGILPACLLASGFSEEVLDLGLVERGVEVVQELAFIPTDSGRIVHWDKSDSVKVSMETTAFEKGVPLRIILRVVPFEEEYTWTMTTGDGRVYEILIRAEIASNGRWDIKQILRGDTKVDEVIDLRSVSGSGRVRGFRSDNQTVAVSRIGPKSFRVEAQSKLPVEASVSFSVIDGGVDGVVSLRVLLTGETPKRIVNIRPEERDLGFIRRGTKRVFDVNIEGDRNLRVSTNTSGFKVLAQTQTARGVRVELIFTAPGEGGLYSDELILVEEGVPVYVGSLRITALIL